MSSGKFFTLLLVVVVFGGAIGGSFIGGLALGQSQDDLVPSGLAGQFELPDGLELGEGFDLAQAREQFASGEFQIPEGVDLNQIRQQFLEGGGGGEGGTAFRRPGGGLRGEGADDGAPADATFVGGLRGGGAPVAGTITEVGPAGFVIEDEDGTETVVTLADDGAVLRQQTLTVDKLEQGMSVVAFGAPDDEGAVEASVVQIID
jgi:hypothetical protein